MRYTWSLEVESKIQRRRTSLAKREEGMRLKTLKEVQDGVIGCKNCHEFFQSGRDIYFLML